MNENIAIFGLVAFILYIVFMFPIKKKDKGVVEIVTQNKAKYLFEAFYNQMRFR